ncbi:hypothetical protein MXD98_16425, partial [Legionella pneumophila]|nr:hypothetical protein [Legionella pneumophila]
TVAQVMVNNDPAFSSTSSTGNSKNDFSAIAKQQFGVPYKASGQVCTDKSRGFSQKASGQFQLRIKEEVKEALDDIRNESAYKFN